MVPDETYQRWMKKIELGQAALDKASIPYKSRKSDLSNIYKEAKGDGVDVDAIKEAFAMDKLDHLDVAQKYENTGRVLRLMRSPLGEQMELFRGTTLPLPVAAAIAGRRAGASGRPNENPHSPGTEPFVAYEGEYAKAQEAIQNELR